MGIEPTLYGVLRSPHRSNNGSDLGMDRTTSLGVAEPGYAAPGVAELGRGIHCGGQHRGAGQCAGRLRIAPEDRPEESNLGRPHCLSARLSEPLEWGAEHRMARLRNARRSKAERGCAPQSPGKQIHA